MANYFDKGIQVTAGFSLGSKAPLDTRTVVENLSDLDNHIAENRCYEGMEVYVLKNKKKYIYNGTTFEEFVSGGGDGSGGSPVYTSAPIGTVLSFAGQTPPNGYLLCDGGSYAVADYQDLYDVIGNIYGGDTEYFNVPNLIDRFIQGSNTSGTEKEAGLPNITGMHDEVNHIDNWKNSGAFSGTTIKDFRGTAVGNDYGDRGYCTFHFDASLSNPIYGNSDTVQPPALTMAYIIKAFHTNEGVDSSVELEDNVVNHIDTRIENKVNEFTEQVTEQVTEQISEGISQLIIVGKEYPTTETCPVGCWYAMYF